MQITPVNNTNFNGQFKKNGVLQSLLRVSNNSTLGRFNEVLNRASKVDDKYIYKINCSKVKSVISHTEVITFILNREDTLQKYTSPEKMVERYVNSYETSIEKLEKCSGVLKDFLPYLENKYPKTEFKESNSELIEKINDKLI